MGLFGLKSIFEKVLSQSPDLNIRFFKSLLVINAIALTGSVVTIIFRSIYAFNEVSFLLDSITVLIIAVSFLFTLNGKINAALNISFFIPILLYAYFLSDFTDHPDASESVGWSLAILSIVSLYLVVFSNSIPRVIVFFLTSLFILYLHVSVAGLTEQFLDINADFIRNPLLIYPGVFSISVFIRNLYLREIDETKENLFEIQQNIRELFMGIRYPSLHVRSCRSFSNDITDLVVERINPAFEAVFGVKSNQVKGQDADYLFLNAFDGEISPFNLFITDFKYRIEIYFKNIDRWFTIHLLQPDSDNFYAIFYETTQEKRVKTELEESKQRYKVLLEAIPDIFFVIGKDGTYEDFVIKDEDQIKIQDHEIIGRTIFEVGFSEIMSGKIFECIQSAILHDSIETIEYALNTPNGTFMFEMRLARLNEKAVISVARDITRRKMAEFRLEEAKEKAEKALNVKSVFLSSLSHNIRTPMNIILGFSKMISEPGISDSERGYLLKGINQNSHLLLKMIDDTINLSKIETNSVELRAGQVYINSVLKDLQTHFLNLLPENKSIDLVFTPEFVSNDFSFITDGTLLSESMSKLIDNSIKFSSEGVIRFGYQMKSTGRIEFFVEDEGPGIPGEELKHIFDRFYIGKSDQPENSGSGLGLPIAQHFIALIGGELKVESKVGKGSKFYFSVPFREGKGYLRIVS